MTGLYSLWLPILLSAVAVFIASSVIHMALPFWHKNDYRKAPSEDAVMDVLRPFAIQPGDYMIPRVSSMEEMRSPEFTEKLKQGPVLIATVLPNGQGSMTQSLILWFIYSVVVSIFAAYIAGRALSADAHYLSVFRLTGASAFMGYSLALLQLSIWYKRSWTTTIKSMIDGLIYALLTAGMFGWLWPR